MPHRLVPSSLALRIEGLSRVLLVFANGFDGEVGLAFVLRDVVFVPVIAPDFARKVPPEDGAAVAEFEFSFRRW